MKTEEQSGKVLENQIAMCGFYCGSCPSYTGGSCHGCHALEPKTRCFSARCAETKGLAYCPQCRDFPCDELLTRENATALSKSWLIWKRSMRDQV